MCTGSRRALRRFWKRFLNVTMIGIFLIGKRIIFDVLSASWCCDAHVGHRLKKNKNKNKKKVRRKKTDRNWCSKK
jgi:hypothetical protein